MPSVTGLDADAKQSGGARVWLDGASFALVAAADVRELGLAVGASLDYAFAHGLANAGGLASKFVDYEQRLRQYYGSRQEDRAMLMKPSNVDYE